VRYIHTSTTPSAVVAQSTRRCRASARCVHIYMLRIDIQMCIRMLIRIYIYDVYTYIHHTFCCSCPKSSALPRITGMCIHVYFTHQCSDMYTYVHMHIYMMYTRIFTTPSAVVAQSTRRCHASVKCHTTTGRSRFPRAQTSLTHTYPPRLEYNFAAHPLKGTPVFYRHSHRQRHRQRRKHKQRHRHRRRHSHRYRHRYSHSHSHSHRRKHSQRR